MKKLEDIKNILIIGCGTLGLRIGLRCAMDGFNVKMYDLSSDSLQKARAVQNKLLRNFVKKGVITEGGYDLIQSRISTTTDKVEAVKNVDLMSESVTEDLELKKKLYQDFAPLWEEKTLLTTNTSYLLPSYFAEETGRPHLFCAFHFHDVFTMNVVDIMPHPNTEGWFIDLLHDFGKAIHQIPVVIQKENPGYLFNQILMAVLGAAGDLRTRDIASIQDIDRSWMGNFKTAMGPFGMLDTIGLETAWHIVKTRKDSRSVRFAALLKTYLDEGKLGLKTGEGFYKYPNPEYAQADFLG
jgi:3-hydroxybutyryl-CoA dehydrogenase